MLGDGEGKYGISNTTCYRWKSKYGGLCETSSGAETENRCLKKMYADLSLEKYVLKNHIIML